MYKEKVLKGIKMNCIKKIANVFVLLLMTTGATFGMDIFQAARDGDIGRIEELLANGADVNPQRIFSMTPLNYAVRFDHELVALRLIAAGIDVNQDNYDGTTPLHWAARRGHERIAIRLIEADADINRTDYDGQTALHHAAIGGHEAIINMLIEAGIDVNQQDNGGSTALHCALSNENAIRGLIEAGADINRQNNDGEIALDLAKSYQLHTIIALLNGYNQRIEQARQRVPVIAHRLAFATHPRLGAESPLAPLPQELMCHITHLVAQAEEVDARRPRQANGAAL